MATDRGPDKHGDLIRLTRLFIERELEPWPEFVATLINGSVSIPRINIVHTYRQPAW